MRYPFASLIIEKVAPELGIRVELEPEFKFAGELIFANGGRHVFRNTNLNINPAASTEIAKDKAYTKFFLAKHGLPVPQGQTFFSPRLLPNLAAAKRRGIAQALAYARELGYPVFVKPNSMSQGELVTKALDDDDVRRTAEAIFARVDVMLVERLEPGRDYRVVVLGDRVISAYERRPLGVVGDGRRTIQALLDEAKAGLREAGRPNSEIDPADPRIDIGLREAGLTRDSVLTAGRAVELLANANLSTGGTSVDVTEAIHPSFAALAVRAARVLGLELAGVDFLAEDIAAAPDGQRWCIVELNAAPGLDNYAAMGAAQTRRVEDLYRTILLHLEASVTTSAVGGAAGVGRVTGSSAAP